MFPHCYFPSVFFAETYFEPVMGGTPPVYDTLTVVVFYG